MKQDYLKRQTEIQNTKSIMDALSEASQTFSKQMAIRPIFVDQYFIDRHLSAGAGCKLCTGPPGRAPSRSDREKHPPDTQVVLNFLPVILMNIGISRHSGKQYNRPQIESGVKDLPAREQQLKSLTFGQQTEITLNTECKNFKSNQIINFLTLLNFKIMKKRILFLTMIVLALLAGRSKSYGQACAPSELTPAAGVEYTYAVTNTGTGSSYDWYVTKNVDLLVAADFLTEGTLFTVAAGTPYHNAATGVNNIKITWTAAALVDGGPFYLVIRYKETTTGTAGCTVENMKAHQIKPINTFLLALEGGTLTSGSYVATAGSNTCAADITGALVTAAAPTALLTYGQNTLYYVATASGIAGDWYPQIRIPALNTSQLYVSAEWSSDMTGGGTFNTFGAVSDGATHDLLSATAATATVAGTPILIKIVIDNVNWQTLADQTIPLGLDGFLPPTPIDIATSKSDVTSTTDCTPLGSFGRTANYVINKRPTIAGTPAYIPLTNP